jgi:hypothetical protein
MPLVNVRQVGIRETIVASAARTATGNSGPLSGYNGHQQAVIQINVTALAGTTPTLIVSVDDSVDGTNFNSILATASITAVGITVLRIPITTSFSDLLRISWTVGGTTPSFTFQVDAFFATRGQPVQG